ncbi:hypothetical protein FQZ97_863550 [compost metagenome]
MILQADPFARLELLHQLLEVLAPNRPFTQVSPQLHEVAGVLARVVLVRRCAVLQQLATDYGWQGRGSGLRRRLFLRLLGLSHLRRRSLGGSALDGLAFLLDGECGFALCEALIHLRIGEVDIEAPLRRHVHDGALELLAALDREGAPEAFPGKVEGDRDAGLAHAMLAQVDRLAGVHEHRLVARLVQVMHVLTEPSALRVHVLGAACLGATRRLELIHGLLGSLDQTLDTLSRRRQPVGTGNGVVRKMLLLPIDQCSNFCTSHTGALWVKLWVGDCLFGLHPLEHQHRHQLGAFLPRKTRVGADQATGFVKALVEVAKGAALGRLQAVVLVLPEGIGRRGGRLTR